MPSGRPQPHRRSAAITFPCSPPRDGDENVNRRPDRREDPVCWVEPRLVEAGVPAAGYVQIADQEAAPTTRTTKTARRTIDVIIRFRQSAQRTSVQSRITAFPIDGPPRGNRSRLQQAASAEPQSTSVTVNIVVQLRKVAWLVRSYVRVSEATEHKPRTSALIGLSSWYAGRRRTRSGQADRTDKRSPQARVEAPASVCLRGSAGTSARPSP